MKNALLGALLIPALAGLSSAQDYRPPFEFSLFGGSALTSVKGTTSYSDTYSSYFGIFDPITESTTIGLKSKSGFFFGGGLSYFFSPHFGLQLSAGFLNSDAPNTSSVDYSRYDNVEGRTLTDHFGWTGTGTLSSIPISLNLVARFGDDLFSVAISGGPTLFLNSFEAASSFGYGIYDFSVQYVYPYYYLIDTLDLLRVGLEIPKTRWMGIGADLGAGVTYTVSPSIGLTLDVRYYFCLKKELSWNFQIGDYDGVLNALSGYSFSQDDVDYLLGVSAFKTSINPSFFKITAGLSLRFGK